VAGTDRVIIGIDPHKLSVTFEARDTREILRATGRSGTDARSYRRLPAYARQWLERVWAVAGANGIGRPLAQRLLASGERVLDVPAKLAARARVFDTGQGRKTDPADALRSSWSRCGTNGCVNSAPILASRCCGCCVTAVTSCPPPGHKR
jgi:transposase